MKPSDIAEWRRVVDLFERLCDLSPTAREAAFERESLSPKARYRLVRMLRLHDGAAESPPSTGAR